MPIINIIKESGIYLGIGIVLILIIIAVCLILNKNPFHSDVAALLSICFILIAPFFEEVFFRAPFLLFKELSIYSVILMVITSGYFGYIHRNNKEKWIKRFNQDKKVSNLSKIFTVFCTGFLGLICSIFTIESQSLLYPVIIHFVYNLTMLLIAGIIATYKIKNQLK